MNNEPVTRDERTLAVENASYRIAYYVLSFGLLVIVAYRSFLFQQASWDLLVLVLASGVIASAHQGANQVLNRRWGLVALATFVIGALLAVVFVLVKR
jgi:hypothetical protein